MACIVTVALAPCKQKRTPVSHRDQIAAAEPMDDTGPRSIRLARIIALLYSEGK
jgi:hypothetical protein